MPAKPIKEVVEPLPEFYLAFVLPGATRSPSAEEVDAIQKQTIKFWGKHLTEAYSKPFIRLDLNVDNQRFGERTPEENESLGLDESFNMVLELSGQVVFNGKFRGLPTGDEVFREMIAGDSMDYLVAFVRGIPTANLFAAALEVTARRLVPLQGGPGGTVVVPSFLVAFGIDQEDQEAQIPDGTLPDDMMEEWKKRTHKAMEANLRKEWPDTFESLTLDTTLAEKGNGKPDHRYQLYTENEASVNFSASPPSQEDVFRVLMKSASTDATVYLLDMHDMDGTPFSCVTTVTIQLVGMEMPEAEELPPAPEEEKEDNEGEAKDGEDDPEEADPYVTMEVPIFMALVINAEPPAEVPKDEELLEFKDLMLRFFYTEVKKQYPQIKYMKLNEKDTKFGAGLPEERFNMCVEYDAILQFQDEEDMPEKEAIQKMIMEVNLSSILAHVQNLKPLCFKHASEVTMRRKSRENAAEPFIPDAAFEAAVDAPPLLMPPSPKDEKPPTPPPSPPVRYEPPPEALKENPTEKPKKRKTEKPKKPKAKPKPPPPEPEPDPPEPKEEPKLDPPKPKEEPKPEPPKPKPDPPKPKEEPKPKPPIPKPEPPKPKEEPKPEPASKPKKPKKKKEPKPAPPPSHPPSEPKPKAPKVQSSDIYCAMILNSFNGPPTDENLELLRKNTCDYFASQLRKHYPNKFADLDLQIASTAWGEEDTKNIVGKGHFKGMNSYVQWVTSASFRENDAPSSPVKQVVGSARRSIVADGLPSPYEMTRAIVRDCDVIKYLLEHVRVIKGSDFTSATSCLIQQRIEGQD